jgi:crotonobetainyl-CoA:carnitine CoA-transferase CaiB-like acyl-CoA transferase
MTWETLRGTEGYRVLGMEQEVFCPGGTPLRTLRCPIRIDGEIYKCPQGAPGIGQHNETIAHEFGL